MVEQEKLPIPAPPQWLILPNRPSNEKHLTQRKELYKYGDVEGSERIDNCKMDRKLGRAMTTRC